MKTLTTTLFLILISTWAWGAEPLSLYFIHPDGEGDTESARPYLSDFYDHLSKKTNTTVSGHYINDTTDALDAFKNNQIDIAIVSSEFFNKYNKKLHLKPILKTVPVYSEGPFERYYIMAGHEIDILALSKQNIAVNLFSSKNYGKNFLNKKLFVNDDVLRKVPWKLRHTPDILGAIEKIAKGQNNTFVLLSGYEFSVIKKLKKTNQDFSKLVLVYTSAELPSSVVVSVGQSINKQQTHSLQNALMHMADSLTGQITLKKLRLKGFAH